MSPGHWTIHFIFLCPIFPLNCRSKNPAACGTSLFGYVTSTPKLVPHLISLPSKTVIPFTHSSGKRVGGTLDPAFALILQQPILSSTDVSGMTTSHLTISTTGPKSGLAQLLHSHSPATLAFSHLKTFALGLLSS